MITTKFGGRPIIQGSSLQSYRRHFVYPLSAAMAAAGIIMLALLIWLTIKSDKQEAVQETEMARLVISSRVDFMLRNQSDYATWDDSVAKLVLALDESWASDNIGPYLYRTQGYEHSFVIDAHDHTTYASDHERVAQLNPFRLVGLPLRKTVTELRTKPVGGDYRRSGVVRIGDNLAAISIAAIIPDPGKVKLPKGPASYLLFIDVLTPKQLLNLGAERGLSNVRFLTAKPGNSDSVGALELHGIDGASLGYLGWSLERPGTTLRGICLPFLLGIMAILALTTVRILYQCRRAVEQTDAAMLQSDMDAREARQALDDLTIARAAAARADAESYRNLQRMVLRDGLTDLPNRRSFNEQFKERLKAKDSHGSVAVVMLDLSRFKVVNDTHGHEAGDVLLAALAARLTAILRPDEFIARLGGDEFAALISYQQADDLTEFLNRITVAFGLPFEIAGVSLTIGANIGVALVGRDGVEANSLLAKADLAMYRAKSVHSGEPCFYDSRMDDAVRSRRELASDLRKAVKDNGFELHYQVQASIETAEIIGYEALIRWRHPTRGSISPVVFISLAEETGEIVPLSIWILRQACFEAALWPTRVPVSVNLSPLHLSDASLIETVRAALADSGLPPQRLTLELTESAIIADRRYALEQLRALKAMGVAIALDDFGAGYSSLDVLRSFPFDRIKLDASFVAEVEDDEQAVSILRSVTALGNTLHMPVLAEAVERASQLAIISREGCSAVQGYLIGRPSRTLADGEHVRQIMTLKPRSLTSDTEAA
jgi:diguanylate cyclase (GGDEF)-like protein